MKEYPGCPSNIAKSIAEHVLPEFDEDMTWYVKSRRKKWIRTRRCFQALRFLFDKVD